MSGSIQEGTVFQNDRFVGQPDTYDVIQQHRDVGLVRENGSNRLGNVRRRQPGRGYLVKQRLEQVMILPIDQRDAGGGIIEILTKRQSAKTGAKHDNVWSSLFHQPGFVK